jgi:hypothetical protein
LRGLDLADCEHHRLLVADSDALCPLSLRDLVEGGQTPEPGRFDHGWIGERLSRALDISE